jgi:hypothetical protein
MHETICKWKDEYEKMEAGLNKPKETDSPIFLKVVCESYKRNEPQEGCSPESLQQDLQIQRLKDMFASPNELRQPCSPATVLCYRCEPSQYKTGL